MFILLYLFVNPSISHTITNVKVQDWLNDIYATHVHTTIIYINHVVGPILGSLNSGMPAVDDILSLREKRSKT